MNVLYDTTITAEAKYSVKITKGSLVLSLHYYATDSFFYANCVKIQQYKEKDFESNYINCTLENVDKMYSR